MPAVAVPADKRFRRAHVKPARRTRMAVRLAIRSVRAAAVMALVAYGAWRATALVLTTSALQVSRVAVSGNERLSLGVVHALVEGLEGEHILRVDLGQWQRRLLAYPWIQEATLRRVLPDTIDVLVRERRPMAIGRIGGRLYLVDRAGVVIDEYGPNYADIDLPIVDGLASVPRSGGPLVDRSRAELAGRLLNALHARPDLEARVSQIDVSDARNGVVILEGDTAMLRIGDRDFAERIQAYIDLAPALRERVMDIDYVDLRFDERLYVRPAASGRGARE
jgi:cell division protein FtsQ